ncbi:MAG: ABC transporter permease subunit [Opitutales bacterium]|jgi:ABC-type transport system involved in multi-copper enzyme maturation permease subunit
MLSPTPFRDTYLVAGFELREMLRSRRAFLIVALYLLVAAFATFNFVRLLNVTQNLTQAPPRWQRRDVPAPNPATSGHVEAHPFQPPPATAVPKGPSQGAFFSRWSPFRGILSDQVTDPTTVDFLVAKPLIALFFMLVCLLAVPILIMITASESIAQEHQTRGVRFTALRTGRVEFVVGKVLGQAFLMAVVVLLSAGLCLAMGAWKLADFEWGPAISAMLVFWPRIVAFCVPFVGLASLCSMNCSSALSARAFALIGIGAVWMVHGLTGYYADTSLAGFFNVLDQFEPYAHESELWTATYATVGPAMAILVGLGVLYVAVGLIFYSRRDL